MNKKKIIEEFHLKYFGSKGWMHGDLNCPECGRGDKFGVLFSDKGAVVHCFYCALSFPLGKLLRALNRVDLLEYEFDFQGEVELPGLEDDIKVDLAREIKLPLGFKRIYNDDYLEGRNFQPWQYEQYQVGIANLDPRTKGKIVFQIFQRGNLSGWLGRSKESKEWHKENLRRHKELGELLVLRYRNSEDDFSKMLGGLDEITPNTHTIILVEGLFDKANIDRLLKLNEAEEVKCCFTFGSDLNVDQVDLIPSSVSDIILLYDANTVANMKEAGGRLMSCFNVQVGIIDDENVDPGNMTEAYLSNLFLHLENFLYFYGQLTS